MMLDLETPQETKPTPQQTAVDCQQLIEEYKLRIEELTAQRDEAIKQALADGIKIYGGYTFVARQPASSISDRKLAETHPDVLDGYLAWYQKTHAPKLTKTDLSKYLAMSNNPNPDKVLADVTEPGKGGPTYSLTKGKEASQ